MKKILPIIIVVVLAIAGYAYHQSTKKPVDVIVASDVVNTGTVEPTNTPTISGTNYNVVANSVIGWKGSKAGGAHTGTVNLTDGFITVNSGTLMAGEFTMNMTSIKILDITDADFEKKLQNDFFMATQFPTSKLTVTSVAQSGTETIVTANLTIKDQTHPISFPIVMTTNSDNTITVTSQFAIDRMTRGLDMRKGMVNDYLEYDINLTFTAL